jgi:hypothetical protein
LKLSRTDAARHLGISLSTFDRYVRAGKITVIRGEKNKLGKQTLWVDFPEIPEPTAAQPEPEPEPLPIQGQEPQLPEIKPAPTPREWSDHERRIADDLAFADAFKRGEATDSLGNTINGINERWPTQGSQSLIGKVEHEVPSTPRTGTEHMNPALLSDYVDPSKPALVNPQVGTGFTRKGSPLAAGYSQEQYDRDMADWRRRTGAPSMSEQRERQERSVRLINEAFNTVKR